MFKRLKINPLNWLGYLFAPIQKNSAFFVFMFALGWICTQLEITLHLKGAHPYDLSAPELFLDIYAVCVVLALIPRKIRYWVRALLYVVLYSVALVDMFCYVKFESTLTPTMLMLFGETNQKESQEFLSTYLGWDVISSHVGWILLLILVHILWTILRSVLCKMRKKMILPKVNQMVPVVCKAVLGVLVAWGLYCSWSECKDNKDAIYQLMTKQTLGEVEHQLTLQPKAELYLPIYRLIFSAYANKLASKQLDKLILSKDKYK